jgi:hypothetical protein
MPLPTGENETVRNEKPDRQLEWIPPKFPKSSWEWRYAAWFNFLSTVQPAFPRGIVADPWNGKYVHSLVGCVLQNERGRFFPCKRPPRAQLMAVSPVDIEGERAIWVHAYLAASPHVAFGKFPFVQTALEFQVQFFPVKPVSQGHIKYHGETDLIECKTVDTAAVPLSGYLEHFLLERKRWAWCTAPGKFQSREFLHGPWAIWATEDAKVTDTARKLIPVSDLPLDSSFVVKGSPVFSV